MRLATAALVLSLAACGHRAPPDRPRDPSDTRYRALVDLLAHAPATGKPVDTIAELLPLLDRDLRSNFTFAFATRSAQHSVDPLHPRVVLFGSDARLILAFTGDPAGPDFDTLEVIHFRDDTRAFELEQFVLPAAVRRDPTLAAAARDNGRSNPRACLRCHGSDPRPIFDSYPVWPGFYGSQQDAFDHAPDELASYRSFLAAKDAPGSVYRALEFPPGSPVSPYSLATAEDTSGRLAPNMRFGMALTERNRERISRMLEASPRYATYRDALVAGLLGCVAMPIDGAARAHVMSGLVAENAAKLDRAGITGPDMREKLHMRELDTGANMTELDYVARLLDVSRADWSMAIEPGAFGLFDGILSGRAVEGDRTRDFYIKEDFLFEMMRDAAAKDAGVAALFATKPYAIHDRVGKRLDLLRAMTGCHVFAERALAAGVSWPALTPSPPPVAFRCVRCHEPGGDGPPIPFDLPARLRAVLAANPDLAGAVAARTSDGDATQRMPLAEPPLSGEERTALASYLQALR